MVHFHYIFTENNFFTPLSIKIFCEETLPFGDSGIRLDIRSVKKPCRSDIRTFGHSNFFIFYFNINITIKIKTWPKITFWPHFVNKYIFFLILKKKLIFNFHSDVQTIGIFFWYFPLKSMKMAHFRFFSWNFTKNHFFGSFFKKIFL